MITKEKILWSVIKPSQLIFKEMYEEQYRDFICGYWALKVIVLIIREYSNEYLLSKTFNVLHVVLIDFVLIARQLI